MIAAIDIQDPSAIQMVSISTTLATNAIAEGKGKRVALFLIGYDPELITSFKFESSFATPNYFYIAGGHDLYGQGWNAHERGIRGPHPRGDHPLWAGSQCHGGKVSLQPERCANLGRGRHNHRPGPHPKRTSHH
ncbi:MAG: hypothetical protein B6I38_08450 [Anaerolineaceae bacterium 4572_5.1]|nr:MAG: hypothetical protein B6I38_08450 [Anaerolineaceae bacterium 4572_5.1]